MHVMRCCITHVMYSGSTNDKSANGLYCFLLKDKTPLIIPLQTINVHALCSYGVFFPHHWTPTTSQQFFSAFSHFELLNFIPAIRCHTITQFSCSVLLIVMVATSQDYPYHSVFSGDFQSEYALATTF